MGLSEKVIDSARVFVLCALTLIAPAVWALEDNPFRNARKGDWAEYTITRYSKLFGGRKEMGSSTEKREVTEVTDTSVTVTIVAEKGQRNSSYKSVFDLRTAYTPIMPIKDGKKVVVAEKARGHERVLVEDALKVEADWREVVATATRDGKKIEHTLKIWTSYDIPMGIVKVEQETEDQVIVVTVKAFGFGTK